MNQILDRGREIALAIETEIRKVIYGPELQPLINVLILAVFADGHVVVRASVGTAKTFTCHALARTIGGTFSKTLFTPDMLPAQITGFMKYNEKTQEFEVEHGPLFRANVFLADEINRATPEAQSAMLGPMGSRELTIGRNVYPLEKVFVVLATRNQIEHEGTYDLPEAQLDRFLAQPVVGDISVETTNAILSAPDFWRRQSARLERVQPVTTPDEIVAIREVIFTSIHVEDRLRDYISRLVVATKSHPAVKYGSSPRGAECLQIAAMIAAFRAGREYATPEDVQQYAVDILAHRVFIKPEIRLDPDKFKSGGQVVREVLNVVRYD